MQKNEGNVSAVWLVVAMLLFSACTATPPGGEDIVQTGIAGEDDGCPGQADVVGNDEARLGGGVTGDIDGDGREDEIYMTENEAADRGCSTFLTVRLVRGDNAEIVSEPIWKSGAQGGLEQPRINSLVQIDGREGLEILVDEMSGASTQFVGAFTFVDGTLERIEAPEATEDIWSGAAEGVFPYGGSVGHIEGADCHADGGIVVSAALPAGPAANTYVVVRRYFDIEGAELTLRDTERPIATAKEVFEDFPEFRASPFGSCPSN